MSDEKSNKYTIAVSSGMAMIGGGSTPPELIYGLGAKFLSITTYGVKFVQVDVESPAEFIQPGWMASVQQGVDSLGIGWSLHGEINETVAWDTAVEVYWRISHSRLHDYLDHMWLKFVKEENEKYKPKFINFHASNAGPIGIFPATFRTRSEASVAFDGISDFTRLWESKSENEEHELKKWFKEYLLEILMPFETFSIMFSSYYGVKKEFQEEIDKIIGEELLKEIIEGHKGGRDTLKTLFEKDPAKSREVMYRIWVEHTKERGSKGQIDNEEIAYLIIAKYMELKKDDPNEPVWGIFFKSETLENLAKNWYKYELGKKGSLIDKENWKVDLSGAPDLIAAVSVRYIMGHFQAAPPLDSIRERERLWKEKNGGSEPTPEFFYKTAFEKMNILKIPFVFENPELSQQYALGRQRIVHLNQIYNFVKSMRKFSDEFGILIDFEHYIHNALDPSNEIKSSPEDVGKFLKAVHLFSPTPLHRHMPIEVGSEDQRHIYNWLYQLRKKGFEEGVFIFERGGGQNPGEYIKTSVQSLRLIAEYLEKDTDPTKLPMEFYGVSREGFYSPDRQFAMIKEHYFDPLKGMLKSPEEDYTFFGKFAIEEGKKRPEEWKKEELK